MKSLFKKFCASKQLRLIGGFQLPVRNKNRFPSLVKQDATIEKSTRNFSLYHGIGGIDNYALQCRAQRRDTANSHAPCYVVTNITDEIASLYHDNMDIAVGRGIKYGLTPDCDFPDFAAYMSWKWRVQNCGACASARLRLDNYRNIADDANFKALASGEAKCHPKDPKLEEKRSEAFKKLEAELQHGWRVDALKRGDFGERRRVRFQTRLNWDYRVVDDTVKHWKKVGKLVENHRNHSFRIVRGKEFKINSDIGGIDRWRLHRMMKGVLG